MRLLALGMIALFLTMTQAAAFTFKSLDGSPIDLAEFRGRPVLVVNTASLCGFTPQYADMQRLHDEFGPRGLVVLAVPSDEFRQELSSNAEVAEFCRVQTGLTFPITQITKLRGPDAHPFFRWLADTHGHVPDWNFNKALIGKDGQLVGFWGSGTRPTSRAITRAIRSELP